MIVKPTRFSDSVTQLKPCQIVSLNYQNTCLYSEVIQVITSRRLCWVRPLLLFSQPTQIVDLRGTSDLLWPLPLFQPALDTEIIPLLSQLPEPNFVVENPEAPPQLRKFIHQVWQAHRDIFN